MRSLLLLPLVPLILGGCNAALVGASVVVLGAGAVLGFECPGYVSVTLRDELTGGELCGEPVAARSGERRQRLFTCATMALPDGTWELRAERGGTPAEVEVVRPPSCERWVYALELTLPPPPTRPSR